MISLGINHYITCLAMVGGVEVCLKAMHKKQANSTGQLKTDCELD